MTLTELKARVDEAEQGSWELNWLVAEALDLQRFAVAQRIERETQESIDAAGLTEHRIGRARREAMYTLNRYTQSVDAALALIEAKLPGYGFTVGRQAPEFKAEATLYGPALPWPESTRLSDWKHAKHNDMVLAVISALLAALIAKEQA